MEKVVSFLTNNIIVIWVAPIVTGLILAIVLKIFSIRKSKKEIKRANLEYKNAILPYVLQKIDLGESVLHAIRDAISIETAIPKKHLYSDQELMNVLIYDISKTRFATEEGKKELIDHICDMFSCEGDEEENIEKGKEKKSNNLMVILPACIGVICIGCMLLIYLDNPQALDDPNETVSTLFIFMVFLSMTSFCVSFLNTSITLDFIDRGLLGTIFELEVEMLSSIDNFLFGKLKRRKGKRDKNNDKVDVND